MAGIEIASGDLVKEHNAVPLELSVAAGHN